MILKVYHLLSDLIKYNAISFINLEVDSGSEFGSSFGSNVGTSSCGESDATVSDQATKHHMPVVGCIGSDCDSTSDDENPPKPKKQKRRSDGGKNPPKSQKQKPGGVSTSRSESPPKSKKEKHGSDGGTRGDTRQKRGSVDVSRSDTQQTQGDTHEVGSEKTDIQEAKHAEPQDTLANKMCVYCN